MSGINRRPALANSALVDVVRRALTGSLVLGGLRTVTFRTLSFGSALSGAIPLDRAIERSVVAEIARGTEAATRASFIYRWLTAEPDPDVIVIDLRDTYTVGPVVALLERLVSVLLPAYHHSTVADVASTVQDAPVRAFSLVLLVALLANLALTLILGYSTVTGVISHVVLLAVAALGTRATMPWAEFVRTRPVRLLVAAFAPPKPPEDRDEPE